MTLKITAVALFLIAIGLVVQSNRIVYKILEQVNQKWPDDQISEAFLQRNMGKLLDRHRQLFPDSGARRQIYIFGIAGVALIFIGFMTLVASAQ